MKLRVALVILFCFLTAGCSSNVPNSCAFISQNLPYLTSATAREQSALFANSEVAKQDTCTSNDIEFIEASHGGQKFIFFSVGKGPANATARSEKAFAFARPKVLILYGIAGGLDRSIPLTTPIIPQSWYDLFSGNPIHIQPNLLKIGQLTNVRSVSASVTSDHFVTDVSEIPGTFKASTVDMETYQVAEQSLRFRVPFVAIRAISDYADGKNDSATFDLAASNAAAAAIRYLDSYALTSP